MEVLRQSVIPAELERVWELVGDPRRYPEWWPRVISVGGEQIGESLEFVQVSKVPFGGQQESTFSIERLAPLEEIHVKCQATGQFARWTLTEARGETFIELRMGIDPSGQRLATRLIDANIIRLYSRRWADEAIGALCDCAARDATASDPGPR